MYSDNENDGLFVLGVELFYEEETKEPIHVVAELLGIYWEEQIWVVGAIDNEHLNRILQYLPMSCFLGWDKWRVRKEIPLKWLEENLQLLGKLPILETQQSPPPKSPFFPRVSIEFMKNLDKRRSVFYAEDKMSVFDYYTL